MQILKNMFFEVHRFCKNQAIQKSLFFWWCFATHQTNNMFSINCRKQCNLWKRLSNWSLPANTRRNEQTNRLTNKQTNKRTNTFNKQTNRQTNKRASKQINKKMTHRQTISGAIWQTRNFDKDPKPYALRILAVVGGWLMVAEGWIKFGNQAPNPKP